MELKREKAEGKLSNYEKQDLSLFLKELINFASDEGCLNALCETVDVLVPEGYANKKEYFLRLFYKEY